MLEAMAKHISGEELRAQANRLKELEAKKKKSYYWIKDADEEERLRIKERDKMTPFNCPQFTPQPFNDRICQTCLHDRILHTFVHSKADYLEMISKKQTDAMSLNLKLAEANEIANRQADVKKKLMAQSLKLKESGKGLDWENHPLMEE